MRIIVPGDQDLIIRPNEKMILITSKFEKLMPRAHIKKWTISIETKHPEYLIFDMVDSMLDIDSKLMLTIFNKTSDKQIKFPRLRTITKLHITFHLA